MVNVTCIKCNRMGSLTRKQTKSKGITYEYWYVEHHIGDKIKWCYLGKYEKLPQEYKKLIHKNTQTDTQNNTNPENLNSNLINQNSSESLRAGRLARLGHLLDVQKVAGSNPARPTTSSPVIFQIKLSSKNRHSESLTHFLYIDFNRLG